MGSAALTALIACAKAIEDRNLKFADSLLEQIYKLADAETNKNQRKVVKYFGEALVRRAYGIHPRSTSLNPLHPPILSYFYWHDFDNIAKISIRNSVMGKKRLHLIDFCIPHLYPQGYLFRGLCSFHGDPLLVRVTVILPPCVQNSVNMEQEKQYLIKEADRQVGVELEVEDYFKVVYANSLGEVDDVSMLDLIRKAEDEVVVIYYVFKLQKLVADEAGATEREWLKLKQINPTTMIVIEEDANHNQSNFITRLKDSFQYYSHVYTSYLSFPETNNYYKRQIGNIVACEGRDRIVRHLNLGQWQSLLRTSGFSQIPLHIVRRFHASGATFLEENGCVIVLDIKKCPMFFISAWTLTQPMQVHFNPIAHNSVSGSNPIHPEDIIQPLQPFPQGSFLNRLAAFAEIYDMLEEIYFKYKIQLALTWAREPTTFNETMSDVYENCSLLIEQTSCYIHDWRSIDFMQACIKHPLLEGQAIAGKALESCEYFHFEPSITKLKECDYPLANAAREFARECGDQAVVAICLQNHINIGDVYVLELFLGANKREIEAKNLASLIFNDLKNMKKIFVTTRVQGSSTGVGFQDEEAALPNIPQGTVHIRNLPQEKTDLLINSSSILKDDRVAEKQGLNEQGRVIPNFHLHPDPFLDSSLSPGMSPVNSPYSMILLETQRPYEQGIGKQTLFEPVVLANNENEMRKENVNNLPNSSAKKRKLTSNVWEEFVKEDRDGKERARCVHCKRGFDGSSRKGTTHLRNHLKTCKNRSVSVAKVKDQSHLIFSPREGDSKTKLSYCDGGKSSFDQDRSNMDVARMIIKHQYPLDIVKHEYFEILLKNLQPMFKLQSQEALFCDILCVYEEEKGRLHEYFDKLSCRFNITISLWAHDLEKIIYCCYRVQFIDDNWELKKKILALKIFGHEVINTRIFFENFKSFLVDWNLDKKVCSLIIHNSSSCFVIAEEIRKNWPSFEASHPSSSFYIDDCIHGLLGKDNSGEKEFNVLENVLKFSDGVIRSSKPYLVGIYEIYKKQSQEKRRSYPLMNVKSDNNWRIYSLILTIAAVLDPRSKFDLVEFSYMGIYDYDAKIQLRKIRDTLSDIFDEYAEKNTSTNLSTLLNAEENIMDSFHRWCNSKSNILKKTEASGSWKSELDKYLDEPVIFSQLEFDVLSWWNEHASSFPILARMARDILAIPLSSIILGSTFNEKAMVHNPIFNGLDPQIIEAMICGRDWLESPKAISNVEWREQGARHEEDASAYLVSCFTEEEKELLKRFRSNKINGKFIGRDKEFGMMDYKLAPLLMVPHGVETRKEYHIEDSVVNVFFKLLKKRSDEFPKDYVNHFSFDSGIATYLIEGNRSEDEVLAWFEDEKHLIGVHKFFLPLCLSAHWVLFYVDTKKHKFSWLDSIRASRISNRMEKEKEAILRWFKRLLPALGHSNANKWPFELRNDIPAQENSVDCGLFVMKYGDCLTQGDIFPFTQEDMAHFRERTFLDIYHGRLYSRKKVKKLVIPPYMNLKKVSGKHLNLEGSQDFVLT